MRNIQRNEVFPIFLKLFMVVVFKDCFMKNLIIDGWNLFSYDGIPNDTEDKKP